MQVTSVLVMLIVYLVNGLWLHFDRNPMAIGIGGSSFKVNMDFTNLVVFQEVFVHNLEIQRVVGRVGNNEGLVEHRVKIFFKSSSVCFESIVFNNDVPEDILFEIGKKRVRVRRATMVHSLKICTPNEL